MAQVDFAACKLFTDAQVTPNNPRIEVVPIAPITSAAAYSAFILCRMVDHIDTPHCLVAQWDGHVIDTRRWRADFLDYDYIGASWPQFGDSHTVGNGGFSLRSRRLMEACQRSDFTAIHPEDIAIGRTGRAWLESKGMHFAPRDLADRFSAERSGNIGTSFGYHGVWHMPQAIGCDAFWDVYLNLDDLSTIRHDFATIVKKVWQERNGNMRTLRMIADRIFYSRF